MKTTVGLLIILVFAAAHLPVATSALYAQDTLDGEPQQKEPNAPASPADVAFKQAMDKDLSFGVGQGRTQMKAVHTWEEVLNRTDISDEQRLFAVWRVASLLAYNFDPERGERPNLEKSKKLFKESMTMIPGLLCEETVNSATQYSSHPGSPMERAERLAECYRFLKTATGKMCTESSGRINRYGYALDKKFFPGIAKLPPLTFEESTKKLERRLVDGQDTMEHSISDFFEYCTDEAAALRLLNLLEDFADPEDLAKWRNIRSRFESKWPTNQAALAALEEMKNRPVPATDACAAEPTDFNSAAVQPPTQEPPAGEAETQRQRTGLGRAFVWASAALILCGVVAALAIRYRFFSKFLQFFRKT